MELEVILMELRSFKLSHFLFFFFFCIVGYRVCVINSYNCQWIFFKPCLLVVDIMKKCMWVFDEARISFDGIKAF